MMSVALEVRGLAKSYGELKALENLNLTIQAGDMVGLLGPNGAGKTTALECILGTKNADAGEVRILGKNPRTQRREIFARVGVQFQQNAWQTGLRVAEACESTACLYPGQPRWRELLKHYDLEKRAKSPIATLSGGEKQKLALLLARLHDPEMVFLDEMTTGLDPLARRAAWDDIRELNAAGTTVLLTSHFMDEVEDLCRWALVIKGGRVLAVGSIDELKELTGSDSLDQAYVTLMGGAAC